MKPMATNLKGSVNPNHTLERNIHGTNVYMCIYWIFYQLFSHFCFTSFPRFDRNREDNSVITVNSTHRSMHSMNKNCNENVKESERERDCDRKTVRNCGFYVCPLEMST